ncbi:hypothetical protein [Enterococcus sp. AZ196]|uniref:hypothetical protein n=1 Tax=Enterococcus sp. AZ196 TaxID=2774659 RepID=UPI003D2E3ECA
MLKISDLELPKENIEKVFNVVQVTRWHKDGEILGWSYECILPKVRFEKINVKVKSSNEQPVISNEELKKRGLASLSFTGLTITPWGRANGDFVNYGLTATADDVALVEISNK